MKNISLKILTLFFGCFLFISCEKDEIGNTATEAMAGEWYVKVDAIDADGGVVYDDPFGNGHFHLDMYNTSNNDDNQMWIDENKNFQLHFKSKINVDLSSMTFSVDAGANEYEDNTITLTEGKLLKGAATTPGGAVADSIVFLISISDDTFPADYGYDKYRIAGFRYTGLTSDEDH